MDNPPPPPGPPVWPDQTLPSPMAPFRGGDENPVWSGWDVLRILVVTFFLIVGLAVVITYAGQKIFYPRLSLVDVAKFPLIIVQAEALAYVLALAFMVSVVKSYGVASFWQAIRWRWPRNWGLYVVLGVVLSVGLQLFAHLLPIPKNLPIDQFFQTPREAWVLSIFGVTLAPLMEEMFFRGFLYPVLTRRLGAVAAVLLTSFFFALIHAQQLGKQWAPVLIIFLVGLALTITRAVTKSVSASVLLHMAYNGTLNVLLFLATDGFRHLDKLNQAP